MTHPTADEDAEPNDDIDLEFTFQGDTVNGYHLGDTTTINVAIIETDTKGVNLSATGMEVGVGNTEATRQYTLVLNSQPTGNVSIEIDGEPSNVTLSPSQVDFSATDWSDPKTVTVTPDPGAKNSTFTLSHDPGGGGYGAVTVSDVGVQIRDSAIAQVVVTTTARTVNENVEFSYVIALTRVPSTGETVTVDLNYNTSDFTGTTSVELTLSNWEAGATVTLTAKNVNADAVKTISYDVSVADTDDSDKQVYDGTETATSTTFTVKNVPE